MTDFLIKSTISLTVFLVFYHLVLEREKIHQFNRFYLLFSIVISFAIPFLTFEIIKIVPIAQNIDAINLVTFPITTKEIPIEEKINYLPYIALSLYGIISFVVLLRFGKNYFKLIAKSKSNPTIKYKNANLVLIDEKTLPHTFLNFIFINFEDYNNRTIEEELYTHELVHVTQKHSLDLLFIEFLKVIFWFNPLLIFYKKAIQLNHEFLADEEIVKTYNNVPFYQNLLLQKGFGTQTIYLASNLNYLVTKKRLIMMTKNTSKKIAVFKKIAIAPILAGLIYFFCIEIVAQEKIINTNSGERMSEITDKDKIRDSYYSGVYVKISDERTKRKDVTLYENLSLEDRRKYLDVIPAIHIEKEIPALFFENLKTKNFKIGINNRLSNKEELKKYQRTDFSYYTYHMINKSKRTKKFPQEYQYTLYTKDYFDKNMKNRDVHFKGDTIIIGNVSYKTAMKNKTTKTLKADTLVWYTEGKEGYNLYMNDSVKKKKSKTIKKESIELKKVVDKANLEDYKKNEVKKLTDFNPGNLKKGYIYMTNKGTFFFIKNDDNIFEYYNRWGFKVNEKGEKLNGEKSDENLKYRTATEEEIEKANYNKDVKSLDDLDKGNKKEGYLYMNNATYFFIKNDKGDIEYFNRWGNHVNNKGEKIVETK